jgi:hypothetical protein
LNREVVAIAVLLYSIYPLFGSFQGGARVTRNVGKDDELWWTRHLFQIVKSLSESVTFPFSIISPGLVATVIEKVRPVMSTDLLRNPTNTVLETWRVFSSGFQIVSGCAGME